MKFHGKVGFWNGDIETSPGVYKPNIFEKEYVGDVLRQNRRFQQSNSQNETFTVTNQISILSDLYAQENFTSIRYVVWNNAKIKVTSVEMNYPRITLELGGAWNGET